MMQVKVISATPLGPVAVIWDVLKGLPKVLRVILSRPGKPASAVDPEGSCAEINDLCKSMEGILNGENIRIPLSVCNFDSCSAFQRIILRTEYSVARGQVTTYQGLALQSGKMNAARAVGRALASNPFALIIPCHRTIRSDGYPGDYQGGPAMKRALLEMEGICFDHSGRAIR